MAEIIKKYVDLTGLTHYDEKIKKVISDADAKVLEDAKAHANGLADNYDAAGTAETKVNELANGQVKTNKEAIESLTGKVGNTEDLGTTAKSDLVSAINEVRNSVSAGGTAAAITIDTATTTDGMAKSYTIKQGDNTVGTIDIPKDMVVSSGTVEKDPAGQAKGTYLVLTLANATSDKVYINVGTLVDIYTAKASATQIQLVIDSTTREISASVVAGSIGATELAANAVTTEKIADGNVTKAKLATAVQASLDKADSALQNADITDLKADVAANKASLGAGGATTLAIADAKKAGTDAASAVTALENGQVKTNKEAIAALEAGQVTTNKTDIAGLQTRVSALEDYTFTEVSNDEIDALFATA